MRRVLAAAVLAACAVSAIAAVSLPAGGHTLVAWTAPHGGTAGVVLVVHGGAWRAADAPTLALMDARARTFAGWGWAAAVVDYRAFADAPGDVVRAFDAAHERYPGRPICAYGESAGGQLALMLAVRRPLACVIDAAGPVDLPRLGGTPQPTGCAYLKRALTHARVIELGAGAGPRFGYATVPAAALRGWWSAVRAQLQRAARPRT